MEGKTRHSKLINNDFYDELAEGWYTDFDHPIALLRAENAARIPWTMEKLSPRSKVLDIGCGAGLLTNALAAAGHQVTGVDLSEKSLSIAQAHDNTNSVNYLSAHAYSLPFENSTFDAVSAMDVLEHVEDPNLLIAEAARVLKPKGIFFFHTFNRNPLSYLIIIKGVEWCVRNAPKNMHVYPLFIKPQELEETCELYKLQIRSILGFRPKLSLPFWKMLATRRVPLDFSFRFCKSLATGYCGYAQKHASLALH